MIVTVYDVAPRTGVPKIGVSPASGAVPVTDAEPTGYPARVVVTVTVADWLGRSPVTVIGSVVPDAFPIVTIPKVLEAPKA